MARTRVFSFRDTGWLKWLGWLDSGPKRRTGPAHGSGTGPSGYLNSGQRGSAARLVQKVRSRSSSELATGKADPRPLFSGQRVVLGAAGRHAPVDWQLNAHSGPPGLLTPAITSRALQTFPATWVRDASRPSGDGPGAALRVCNAAEAVGDAALLTSRNRPGTVIRQEREIPPRGDYEVAAQQASCRQPSYL